MRKGLKYIFLFLAIGIAVILLIGLSKALFVLSIYSFFLGKISSILGLDLMPSRVVAILATMVTIMLLPWVTSFLLLGRRKKELFIATAIVVALFYLSLHFGTTEVFFDRSTGEPAKYYIKTMEGFKFSSSGDFDPKFGIKYKFITPEVVKEYFFWQRTGKLEVIPEVIPGRYFDMITGEPIVWYSEEPDGTIKLFPLPGHDPATGELLKPITKEIAAKRPKPVRTEPAYDRTGIINSVKKGKIDLDWYFRTRENALDLESEMVNLGRTRSFWEGGKWEHQFDLYVEKIIFLPPSFTIVGVCYKGAANVEQLLVADASILDSKGIKHQPLSYLGVEKTLYGFKIQLLKGEVRRVFYVLEYVPPEALQTGAHTGAGDDFVRFWAKSAQSSQQQGRERSCSFRNPVKFLVSFDYNSAHQCR